MPKRSKARIACGMTLLVLGCLLAVPGRAVWEHAPISQTTRLPAEQPAVWEMGFIFNHQAVYPSKLRCPAGFRVVIHVLNISPVAIVLRRGKGSAEIRVESGGYYRWQFGKVPPGDHVFYLSLPRQDNLDHRGHDHAGPSPLQTCHVLAGTWPGSAVMYRTAWIAWQNRLLPSRLPLPAGRHCQVFLGAGTKAPAARFTLQSRPFEIRTGEVTLTEFLKPRGQKTTLEPVPYKPAIFHIR